MHTSSDFDTLLFSMEKETSLSLAYSARGLHLTCWWHIKDQITVMNTRVLMDSTLFCIIFSWAGSITADTFSTSEYFYGTSLILTLQIQNIDIWALASLIGGGEGILLCGPRSHSITSSAGPHCWSTLLVHIPGRQCWPAILAHTTGPHCFAFPCPCFSTANLDMVIDCVLGLSFLNDICHLLPS